jgi:hypothetical protein
MIRLICFAFVAYCLISYWLCDKYTPPSELPAHKKHTPLGTAKSQPARHNGAYFCDTLLTSQPGEPLLDLFQVPSFYGVDRAGAGIRVFQGDKNPNPSVGDFVRVEGVFMVLQNDSYYDNDMCLFAVEMEVLDQRFITRDFYERFGHGKSLTQSNSVDE